MKEIAEALTSAIQELFNVETPVELTRPDEQFGDYATNVALQLAKQLGKNPREIGEQLAAKLRDVLGPIVKEISVAGPGFINLTLSDATLLNLLGVAPGQTMSGQQVIAEYSDANPFKVLHAGHVYTTSVGDAIANLLEHAGATVHRVNYGGDVGLHVGKTMWAIIQKLGGELPDKLAVVPETDRAMWMAERYVEGEQAYNDNEAAKALIIETNKHVYQLHAQDEHDSAFAQIYWTCRQWSYQAFDAFFAQFGTKMEKYYPESEVSDLGLQTVKEHIGAVFEQSDGAIIFNGEKYGLHTRVFINQHGLPTYEAKDVGLIAKKYADYHFDRSIIVTDNEQEQYMAVVLKAVEQFWPDLVRATTHITHGKVKLKGGVKMSSRKGNIVRASEVLAMTKQELVRAGRQADDTVMLGAVKYAFLKTRIGGDIIYDPKESIALEGNSGPYLQYAHARARNILKKAGHDGGELHDLDSNERSLARKIGEYTEVVDKAARELMPHHVCTYLYELAQTFNRFYEHAKVVGDPREATRLRLVELYANVLQDGLKLLGIAAPDKM
ncbi:MAG TPA: arginine--tRNA ligase [Candidatus Saccharimonadales bacterium]|nr:arginine--tRNA ligase [Candidatus Saccharimonadales bacterium]